MNGTDVDVLVLTALKDELDAVIGLGQTWTEDRDAKGFRSFRCILANGSIILRRLRRGPAV